MRDTLTHKNIYLLIGGGCHEGHSKKKIAEEIKTWINFKKIDQAKVLFVPFAKDPIFWKKTVDKFVNSVFADLLAEEKITTSTAVLNGDLQAQINSSDVIFFSGGTELNLIKVFKKVEIPKKNKIIIGSSAGTNFLSTFYYSNDRQKIESGLGLLPISTICHYSVEKREKVIELSNSSLHPVYYIYENEFLSLVY